VGRYDFNIVATFLHTTHLFVDALVERLEEFAIANHGDICHSAL
jgi:hypothetical protein